MTNDAEEETYAGGQHMNGDGTLAAEIQRKTAEIENWPAWAKPYERPAPSVVPDGDQASGRPDSGTEPQPPGAGGVI